MHRLLALILLGLIARGAAFAQTEPRLIQSTEITPPAGLVFAFPAASHRLLPRPDGTLDTVLVSETERSIQPVTIELARFGADGSIKARSLLVTGQGETLNVQGPFALPSGDVAVLSGVSAEPRSKGLVLIAGPDTRLKTSILLADPHYAPLKIRSDCHFDFSFVTGQGDGTIIAAGAYGPGPYSWWWARYATNGARLAELGSSMWGIPNRVDAGRVDPDGGFRAVASEINVSIGSTDLWLHRYDGRNVRTLHRKLVGHTEAFQTIFDGDEVVVADSSANDRLSFFTTEGEPKRSISLHGLRVSRLVADRAGLLMLVDRHDDQRQIFTTQLVRLDRGGNVRWQSAPGEWIDVAPANDGTIWALVQSDNKDRISLQRLADP